MSKMKRFIEQVSVDMGYDGMITNEVLNEAGRRLKHLGVNEQGVARYETQNNERHTHRVPQRFRQIICEISEED